MLVCHLVAEALLGRGDLRILGRSMAALEQPSAADFASQSVYSLPATSL